LNIDTHKYIRVAYYLLLIVLCVQIILFHLIFVQVKNAS